LNKIIVALYASVYFSACAYDKLETKPCAANPEVVSFSEDLIPLFTTNCAIPNCHIGPNPAGNLQLDSANAYAELTQAGSGYVDTTNARGSILYIQMTVASSVMPPSGKLDDCKIDLIEKWIQQGGKRN
jgi:hypothetical protein